MYDDLVISLRNNADHYMTVEGAAGLVHLLTDAADAIEELTATAESYKRSMEAWADEAARAHEMMPRWIPVTERLPEKRKWVLCRCEANIIEVLRWENNEWYHDPMHVYYPSFVTHWMPLPEPPKEEA